MPIAPLRVEEHGEARPHGMRSIWVSCVVDVTALKTLRTVRGNDGVGAPPAAALTASSVSVAGLARSVAAQRNGARPSSYARALLLRSRRASSLPRR